MAKRAFFLLAALAIGAACADDPKRPPPASGDLPNQPGMGGSVAGGGGVSDAGRTDSGANGKSDAATACTDLPITGAVVDQIAEIGDPPPGSGGTVLDGIYDIIEARFFAGASGLPGLTGNSYRGTIRITGQSFERALVFTNASNATSETHASGTFTPGSGNGSATIAFNCPALPQEQVTYSVTNDNLIVTDLLTKVSFTYTKTQ
jgi:hypothetical protein